MFCQMLRKIIEVSEHFNRIILSFVQIICFKWLFRQDPREKNDAKHSTKASFLPRSGRVRPGSFAGSAARPAAPPATRQAGRTPKRPLHPLAAAAASLRSLQFPYTTFVSPFSSKDQQGNQQKLYRRRCLRVDVENKVENRDKNKNTLDVDVRRSTILSGSVYRKMFTFVKLEPQLTAIVWTWLQLVNPTGCNCSLRKSPCSSTSPPRNVLNPSEAMVTVWNSACSSTLPP